MIRQIQKNYGRWIYEEMTAAAAAAKEAGMLLIGSGAYGVDRVHFIGLGRAPLADPDLFGSYEPEPWWADQFYTGRWGSDCLLLPVDSRAIASPIGPGEYVFYREGGWSWLVPYIAGVYALAVQVDPTVTPDRFWELAMQTGRTIQLQHEGQSYSLGPILDPVALIDGLQQGR